MWHQNYYKKQFFHVILFIMLYKVVLTFEMKPSCATIQKKTKSSFLCVYVRLQCHQNYYKKQFFHVILFIMLYKVALTFKFVDETLVYDRSNKSF